MKVKRTIKFTLFFLFLFFVAFFIDAQNKIEYALIPEEFINEEEEKILETFQRRRLIFKRACSVLGFFDKKKINEMRTFDF